MFVILFIFYGFVVEMALLGFERARLGDGKDMMAKYIKRSSRKVKLNNMEGID